MNVVVRFDRQACRDLDIAGAREWLVTNGIGGFASGTIAGGMTRRYHGLLIAALQPPVGRIHLVAGFDEIVKYGGKEFALATHWWASGAIEPRGFLNMESFQLEGTTPVWTYSLDDALLEKRVWMRQSENTTFVQYKLVKSGGPLEIQMKAFVNYRDFHGSTHAGDWRMDVRAIQNGVEVRAFNGATPFFVKSSEAECEVRNEWYRDYFLRLERERGLDDREDHLFAAEFRATLGVGAIVSIAATTEPAARLDAELALREQTKREEQLRKSTDSAKQPDWVRQLALAADQFIVKRPLPGEPEAQSVIAGYHWFGDWGRDTMVALPGLALVTGRASLARGILLAFSRYVDGGMLPNNFPDAGGAPPQYNTVDAALWYFEATRQYFEATRDAETLEKLFPVLAQMVEAHRRGTRYNIHVDADGLLYAGATGVQLTWMDAKVGDWVVTPRIGKPVEINALWVNALEAMAQFARVLDKQSDTYTGLSLAAKRAFPRFWNEKRHCCFDVIDAPGIGNDESLRPNQILAVSLPANLLLPQQQKAVVDVCVEHLLTPYGLRSLGPEEPEYQGRYRGGPRERDGAYHQGTVWGWLLGPFASAHFRVYKDRKAALAFLERLGTAISLYGLGTLPEIFEGDAPFLPRGCIAQAWTVGQILQTWKELQENQS